MYIIKKIIFILVLVVVLIAILGFISLWYYQKNLFSPEILEIKITGPSEAQLGDEIEYTVTYKNKGNFVLEDPRVTFQLPDNSLTEDDEMIIEQHVKNINPSNEESLKFKVRLLGKEGDIKTARARLSYKPRNLSARYEFETNFDTRITSIPIALAYDLPAKAQKGQEIHYSIHYLSNVDYPLENLSIKINPVQEFDFKSTEPASLDNTEWKLDTLQRGQGGGINITGILLADVGSHVNFSASLGMWQEGRFIIIKEINQNIEVTEPPLPVSLPPVDLDLP